MQYELLKTDNWDIIFRKELSIIFKSVKNIVNENLSNEDTILKFKSIADNFYEYFKNSNIPIRAPIPVLDANPLFYSTSIMLPYGCFLVPYSIFQTYREDININFDEEFSQNVGCLELIGLINQKRLNQRKKLTKTTVLICKALSRYGIEGQIFKFPITAEIIGNRTKKSLSIVRETFSTVYGRDIARQLFLLNPWKLGWELYLITYPFSKDNKFKEFDKISLAFEVCTNDKMFRIIQIPMIKESSLIEKIKTKLKRNNGALYSIHSTDFNWDLSRLESREDESFKTPPIFFAKTKSITESNVHFEYNENVLDWFSNNTINFDKKLEKKLKFDEQINKEFTLTDLKKNRILKILNFLIEFTTILNNFENTAKKIGIPVEELSTIIHFLIEKKVVALGHRFKFIGAGREYSFIIENISADIRSEIKQALLKSVFSYFYESDSVIAGRCQIPDNWVANFIEFFTRLQFKYQNLKLSYGQRLMGYNFFKPNVKLPPNYVLNEFGMNLKT